MSRVDDLIKSGKQRVQVPFTIGSVDRARLDALCKRLGKRRGIILEAIVLDALDVYEKVKEDGAPDWDGDDPSATDKGKEQP